MSTVERSRWTCFYCRGGADEDVERIVSGYQSGKTSYDLAEEFHCNKGTITKVLREHGVTIRKGKKRIEVDADKVIAMYQQMHTISKIAKSFGVNAQVISRCLKEHGVTLRTRWDYTTE